MCAGAAAPSAAGLSPQFAARRPAVAAAGGRNGGGVEACGGGDEPTLELAAGVSQGVTLQGLEDGTIEDFALPPDMMGAAGERPITMPFSGGWSHVEK